jgi:hypothetical protein
LRSPLSLSPHTSAISSTSRTSRPRPNRRYFSNPQIFRFSSPTDDNKKGKNSNRSGNNTNNSCESESEFSTSLLSQIKKIRMSATAPESTRDTNILVCFIFNHVFNI